MSHKGPMCLVGLISSREYAELPLESRHARHPRLRAACRDKAELTEPWPAPGYMESFTASCPRSLSPQPSVCPRSLLLKAWRLGTYVYDPVGQTHISMCPESFHS